MGSFSHSRSIAFALMLIAAGVAFHAILEITDAFLQVLFTHLPFAMLVATITGIGRKTGWVTRRTSCSTAMP
jgi:hypothetical protein